MPQAREEIYVRTVVALHVALHIYTINTTPAYKQRCNLHLFDSFNHSSLPPSVDKGCAYAEVCWCSMQNAETLVLSTGGPEVWATCGLSILLYFSQYYLLGALWASFGVPLLLSKLLTDNASMNFLPYGEENITQERSRE